jgi:hypothetical protein
MSNKFLFISGQDLPKPELKPAVATFLDAELAQRIIAQRFAQGEFTASPQTEMSITSWDQHDAAHRQMTERIENLERRVGVVDYRRITEYQARVPLGQLLQHSGQPDYRISEMQAQAPIQRPASSQMFIP